MEKQKKEEAYKDKPPHLKDAFEFDPKNLKEEDNKNLTKETKSKNKKEEDALLDRFANFTEDLF